MHNCETYELQVSLAEKLNSLSAVETIILEMTRAGFEPTPYVLITALRVAIKAEDIDRVVTFLQALHNSRDSYFSSPKEKNVHDF